MLDLWPSFFPDCEPVAHHLRKAFPSRWVRFHSLPESKRYPADESELATVLGRQNCMLEELAGRNSQVILLTTEYSWSPCMIEMSQSGRESRRFDEDAKPWRTVPMHEQEGDSEHPCYWHIFAYERAWSPGVLDSILTLVAEDRISDVMILHPGCEWLFHPYDGGMDLLLETSSARDRIKSNHAAWLSPRSDGL